MQHLHAEGVARLKVSCQSITKTKQKKENKTVYLRTVIIGKGNKLLSVQSFNRSSDKKTFD